MFSYSRRTADGNDRSVRGRSEIRPGLSTDTRIPNNSVVVEKKTKWTGSPSRYKNIERAQLDTIITGHLTQEQIQAYQQYFRVEEISEVFRKSQQERKDVLHYLPSGNLTENPHYKRDPSPPPTYDNHGNRTNTREEVTKAILDKERHYLVEIAASNIKEYVPPIDYRKPLKTFEKIYIPVKDYPDINFVGLLLGPRGNTLRQLQDESGAKLAIRGKGSVKDGKSTASNEEEGSGNSLAVSSFSNPFANANSDDLHVIITSDSQSKIAKAIKLTNEVIEKAVSSPVGQNDLKRGQLRELAVLNGTLRETKPYDPEMYQRRQQSRYGPDVSQIVCKICNKVGHFARDCKFKNGYRNDYGQEGSPQFQGEPSYTHNDSHGDTEKERDRENEEDLPPWKRKKLNTPLPPWQRSESPLVTASPPPPPGFQSQPPQPPQPRHAPPPPPPSMEKSVRPPPPPPSSKVVPPPPKISNPSKSAPPPPPPGADNATRPPPPGADNATRPPPPPKSNVSNQDKAI